MFQVVSEYPGDAAHRSDYFTRADRGNITTTDAETGIEQVRPERIITTNVHVEFEGYICLGETTVRHLAHLLGMVDEWRMQRLVAIHEQTVTENLALSAQVTVLRDQVEALRQLAGPETRDVYIDATGTRHESQAAAESGSRLAAGIAPRGIDTAQPISKQEAPAPKQGARV